MKSRSPVKAKVGGENYPRGADFFSVRLFRGKRGTTYPYRLLFVPADPLETGVEDEKQRWQSIKSIEVTSIEDTH